MSMFWGLALEHGKRYTQCVEESFHISQAALDATTGGNDGGPVQLLLEHGGSDFVLATLSKSAKIYQVPLDLNFKQGDQVSFRTVGAGTVHLTGYCMPDEDELESRLMNEMSDDELEDIEEDEEDTEGEGISSPPGKRKKKQLEASNKKTKVLNEEDSDEDSDYGFDSSFGESTLAELEGIPSSEDDEDMNGSEDDDEDGIEEEDDDDDEDSDEEETTASPKKEKKGEVTVNGFGSAKKNKHVATPGKALQKSGSPATPQSEKKTPKDGKKVKQELKSPKTPKQDGVKTPKQDSGKAAKQDGSKTPKQDGSKTPKQDGSKTPKTDAKSPSQQVSKKVLEGGVISEELKVGEGPAAKPGKNVQVYYVGKLKSNNKQFDATTNGKGFQFRLGRGEVIKGWDIGVSGMRVGGKRRLTIPANFAYGSKGSPPVIPPNSTLVFDVELRGLS